jgi:hypothetical protein
MVISKNVLKKKFTTVSKTVKFSAKIFEILGRFWGRREAEFLAVSGEFWSGFYFTRYLRDISDGK